MKTKNNKFKRTRSSSCTSASTLHFQNRTEIFSDDIQRMAQNTIIPFISDKYEIVNKSIRKDSNTPDKQVIIQNENAHAHRLAAKVIFNRVNKMVRIKTGKQFLRQLRYRLIKEKLQLLMTKKILQYKKLGFIEINKVKNSRKHPEKILLLHFMNKKVIFHHLSYAFRKIILYKSLIYLSQIQFDSLQFSKSTVSNYTQKTQNRNNRYIEKTQVKTYQNQNLIRTFDNSMIETKNRPLKPDTKAKTKLTDSTWTVRTSFINQNQYQ